MKNLMTIFSVVVLFAFAMTTIGCDKKKDSTATFTVTVPDAGYPINADGTLDKTKTTADLALSKLPKKDKEYTVTVIKVKKLGDAVTATVIGSTNIAKDTDTGKVSVTWAIEDPQPATGKDAEYEFHALATSAAFTTPAASPTPKTLAEAWTAIEKAQVDANKKSTILATAKSFKKGTIKKATS